MKPLLYLGAAACLLSGSACSRGDAAMQNPHNYKSVSNRGTERGNDKRQYKQTRGGSLGTGLDLKSNNPYQFRTVKGSKKFKYSNGNASRKAASN
ncbi:hypothetical protein LJ737_26270 [Hymenobacter sp. 15J16-1T3B]|uniref:hypothetical protein n=1 Tax=Hymenobacter sp. 15J16-1T3B TaxID=2886941 RepID=UPI001D1069B7|nr:hypothetical protein [Hymenobacter sp. 15J16-1T3B]MCC3160770.1 hypothetical protein [Hymenobacter sp. 15J16-1T3B]